MKTKLLYSTLLSTILLFTGCAKEDNMQLRSGPEATVLLNVPMRAVGSGEDEIKDVRVVSFIPQDADNAPGWMEVNGGKRPLESNTITQTLRTGIRDIYVFANETAVRGLSAQLDGMLNLADLKAIKVPYSGRLTPPFLCSYDQSKVSIEEEGSALIEANVVRAVSKVALTLNCKWGEGTDMLPEEIVIQEVQVKQLPKYSYLVGELYDGDGLVDSEILQGDVLENKSTQTDEYKSDELVLYIPEFLGATAAQDKHAFIEIIGALKSFPVIKFKYKIPLGDGMTSTPMTNYDITRNTKFEIAATIKSFGDMDNMFVKVKVLPWNTVSQNDETGRFITYTKMTDAADKYINDGYNLDDMGTTIKVICNTNIGGWYTVTRDMNNKIVHKSTPTPSVSMATSQTVDVKIPKLAEEVFGQNYTVSIYHPTIAMESVGPVKSLKVVQHGGFIPNSVLSQGFTVGGITYQGWPTDRLPKKGLQIAKRGNVLPTGASKGDDQKSAWTNSDLTNTGIRDTGLGKGKGNYAQLSALSATAFPLGQVCKDLGPEWYVPSCDELLLIAKNKNTIGSSYSFIEMYYWSTTEINESRSWSINFYNGLNSNTYKPNAGVYVRCVREL